MGRPRFIPALNGLRALAALAVFEAHSAEVGLLPSAFKSVDVGKPGVILFFCVSGFLMAELYLRQNANWSSIWRFGRARFARIYPLFATIVLVSMLVYRFDDAFPFSFGCLRSNQTFAFLWRRTHAVDDKRRGPVLSDLYSTMAGLCSIPSARPRYLVRSDLHRISVCPLVCPVPGRQDQPHTLRTLLPGRDSMAVALWHVPADRIGRAAGAALPILIPLLLLMGEPWSHDPYRSLSLLTLAGIIISAAAIGEGFFAERILGSRLMVYLGEVSFGIYLLHRPVTYFWENFEFHWTVKILVVVTTVLVASHFAHVWIERPARQALSRRPRGETCINATEPSERKMRVRAESAPPCLLASTRQHPESDLP